LIEETKVTLPVVTDRNDQWLVEKEYRLTSICNHPKEDSKFKSQKG